MSLVKLDYDCKTLTTYNRRKWLLKYLNLTVYKVEKTRTKHGGWHIYIYVSEKLSSRDIVAIQTLLGSDYRREVYNLFRVWKGFRNWNALFAPNEKRKLGVVRC